MYTWPIYLFGQEKKKMGIKEQIADTYGMIYIIDNTESQHLLKYILS